MITSLNFTLPNVDLSASTLGIVACGSAAIAVWHRVDRRNDMEENKIRNSAIQTAFLSLSSMFAMLWAMSGSNVSSMTKAAATLCAGATTTIPVDIVAARSFSSYQEEPTTKITVLPRPSDTSVEISPKCSTEGVAVLEETSVDQT